MDFVKRNTKKMWKKGPVYRIEYPEYPERAVQEALVNALIHRDYSVIGSEVHVDIYDDRLEIYSPGGMYDGTFVQDLNPLNVYSIRRNPIIADVFARMDLMERRGSGLRKIIEAYEAEDNYKEELKPEFKSTESSFTTILKNLNYDTQNVTQNITQNVTQSEGQNDGQKLKPSDRREKILEIIRNNPKITAYDLSKQFNVTDRTIKRDLKVLTDEKTIEYIGSAKDGYWKVNK
ncbi:ATP-binding protein [Urinicoccus massiliensis]|uniref:ATP-binding protein n=1 Tax=Urinicoccus massiliensis TaxID=1723382 RepID=UPI002159AE5A|nr:ATP-binding protein [Urinicoccus massiliensis]